jgi:hypothetical protein
VTKLEVKDRYVSFTAERARGKIVESLAVLVGIQKRRSQMNQKRRKDLARAATMIEEAKQVIQDAANDEEMALENLAENLKEGQRGETMQTAVSYMEEAVDRCDEAISSIESAGE